MGNFKNDILYFSILASFVMGGMLSFTDFGAAKIAMPEGTVVERTVAQSENYELMGRNCADKLVEIKITKDWKQDLVTQKHIQNAFKSCLSEYVQIKTISPDGNEEKAVAFFESVFSTLKIPHKKFDTEDLRDGYDAPRVNIVATLSNSSLESGQYDWSTEKETKSILLVNHMDVVDVHPEQWKRPDLAFSAAATNEP